jgi:hypothetical protein
MSFGASIGDGILLAQLAYKTVQGARQAGGEHDELAQEVNGLYRVLNRLQMEIANPQSPINRANDDRRQELEYNAAGCKGLLKAMDSVLRRYNKMGPEERRGTRWWQKIRFGQRVPEFGEIRIKLSTYTSAILMSLNLCSMDSIGKMEAMLGRVEANSAKHGDELKGIRRSLHRVTAKMSATMEDGSGSVWTSYTNDDKTFWRNIRSELVKKGYNSSVLHTHKRLIKKYLEELGSRGVFDDEQDDDGKSTEQPPLPEAQLERLERFLEADADDDSGPDSNATVLQSPIIFERSALSAGTSPSSSPAADEAVENNEVNMFVEDKNNVAIENSDTHIAVDIAPTLPTPSSTEKSVKVAFTASNLLQSVTNASPRKQYSAYVEDCVDEEFLPSLIFVPYNDVLMELATSELEEPQCFQDVTSLDEESILDTASSSSQPVVSDTVKPAITSEASLVLPAIVESKKHLNAVNLPEISASSETPASSSASMLYPKSMYAVQIEEVIDEAFETKIRLEPKIHVEVPAEIYDDTGTESDTNATLGSSTIFDGDSPAKKVPAEIYDDSGTESDINATLGSSTILDGDSPAKKYRNQKFSRTTPVPTLTKKPLKRRVHFAEAGPELETWSRYEPAIRWRQEDLRWIFYHEYRDFETYQELRESYQVLWEESQAQQDDGSQSSTQDSPEQSTFITHSPYTPPATLYNLAYWRIPASYYHSFWHPERVPLYLHGNVFDGISLANWINGWAALEFGEESFQMTTIRKFGDTVRKLGAAVSDIDNATIDQKHVLPRDLYDLGTDTIWKQLEDVLKDIMSQAQMKLSWASRNSRLEEEFVKHLWANHIIGAPHHMALSRFQLEAEDWIKKVRLHPAFAILWTIFEL